MTDKLFSLLELEPDKIYIRTTNEYFYTIKNNTLLYKEDYYKTLTAWRTDRDFWDIYIKQFKEVKEKKKITMYRLFIFTDAANRYFYSNWDSNLDFLKNYWVGFKIIGKPEEKIVEIEE